MASLITAGLVGLGRQVRDRLVLRSHQHRHVDPNPWATAFFCVCAAGWCYCDREVALNGWQCGECRDGRHVRTLGGPREEPAR